MVGDGGSPSGREPREPPVVRLCTACRTGSGGAQKRLAAGEAPARGQAGAPGVADRPLAAAAAADEATARGQRWGPLHGVAMTVKDSLATAGVRTTSGSRDLVGYVPDEDCPAVAALRRSGAIMFGKTNLAEYAADVQTH